MRRFLTLKPAMKTIFAFSDIHERTLPPNLEEVANESDYVFFLGDGAARLACLSGHKNFYAVRGNCDIMPLPAEQIIEVEGVRILLTHGDAYRVKSDLLSLSLRAAELGCSLAVYGHTHFAERTEYNGVTLINPGALSHPMSQTPTYAYIVIEKGKILSSFVPVFF